MMAVNSDLERGLASGAQWLPIGYQLAIVGGLVGGPGAAVD
jgi:hypothetical protein